MESLRDKLKERLASGLRRKTLTSCSKWAQECIIMGKPFPGPFNFDHHPWTREMHDSEADFNVGQKAAQLGFTVVGMNRTFYKIDIERVNCLYLLPTKTPDATDFSATRFDSLLEISPHLEKLFSDVKNVATKRAGSATLYIRGANSRSGLKSIPCSFLVFDEYDEMNQANVPLALERMSGQLDKQAWAISTPTVPDFGINELFKNSSQEHFFFKCPSCSKQIQLEWPDSFEICGDHVNDPDIKKSRIRCNLCDATLKHEDKEFFLKDGIWVPQNEIVTDPRGFYINQLYSATIWPHELARAYFLSLSDAVSEQEFFNSKMGLPHVVEGAQVTTSLITSSTKNHRKSDEPNFDNRLITMGVDVGRWLHFEIDQWIVKNYGNDINIMSDCKVLYEGKVQEFEELDKLMRQWMVLQCVIDANPERRKAFDFAKRFEGYVKLCFYGKNLSGKQMQLGAPGEHTVTVGRTSWLDMSLGRFHNGTIFLPQDVSTEYKAHIMDPIRVYEKDKTGNLIGRYINRSDDHFAHARNYSEIALPLAVSLQTNRNVESFL